MVQIALAVVTASAVLTAPLVTPANAQVDMRTGLHLDDRDPSYDRQCRGYAPTSPLASVQVQR
jgi:hypothetical protein